MTPKFQNGAIIKIENGYVRMEMRTKKGGITITNPIWTRRKNNENEK